MDPLEGSFQELNNIPEEARAATQHVLVNKFVWRNPF